VVGHDDRAPGFGQEFPVKGTVPKHDMADEARKGVGEPIDHGVAIKREQQE
jgi:hypothetical protein